MEINHLPYFLCGTVAGIIMSFFFISIYQFFKDLQHEMNRKKVIERFTNLKFYKNSKKDLTQVKNQIINSNVLYDHKKTPDVIQATKELFEYEEIGGYCQIFYNHEYGNLKDCVEKFFGTEKWREYILEEQLSLVSDKDMEDLNNKPLINQYAMILDVKKGFNLPEDSYELKKIYNSGINLRVIILSKEDISSELTKGNFSFFFE